MLADGNHISSVNINLESTDGCSTLSICCYFVYFSPSMSWLIFMSISLMKDALF